MKNLVVRQMKEKDLEKVYELSCESFSRAWSLDALAKELTNPVAGYQVAERDGEIIGYAGLWCVLDEGEITNIAVKSDCRGQGIGSQLLKALLELAETKGLSLIHLEVRESNKVARALYKNHAFKEVAIRKNYYHEPLEHAVIMQCTL